MKELCQVFAMLALLGCGRDELYGLMSDDSGQYTSGPTRDAGMQPWGCNAFMGHCWMDVVRVLGWPRCVVAECDGGPLCPPVNGQYFWPYHQCTLELKVERPCEVVVDAYLVPPVGIPSWCL